MVINILLFVKRQNIEFIMHRPLLKCFHNLEPKHNTFTNTKLLTNNKISYHFPSGIPHIKSNSINCSYLYAITSTPTASLAVKILVLYVNWALMAAIVLPILILAVFYIGIAWSGRFHLVFNSHWEWSFRYCGEIIWSVKITSLILFMNFSLMDFLADDIWLFIGIVSWF